MKALISLDPGAGACWARWVNGRLVACGSWPCYDINAADELIIEDQVILRKFTKKPAAIVKLAQRAGAAAAVFGFPEDETRVTWVPPRSWKGGTKKPKTAAQWEAYVIHRLVVQALHPDELVIYEAASALRPDGARHDLADGVGIGLWKLGRLKTVVTKTTKRESSSAKPLEGSPAQLRQALREIAYQDKRA